MDASDSNQANSDTPEQPATILAYPQPPLQYITTLTNPNNFPPPPPPITDGFYHMFGHRISLDDAIISPLESTTTKRLYPRGYDHKKELKKINASILVNFLDLIDVLVRCPDTEKRIEKCNDLATLFINFHHLINELRPHQARETLRVWLTCQKKSRIDITHRLNKEMQKTVNILQEFKNFEKNYPREPLALAAQGKIPTPPPEPQSSPFDSTSTLNQSNIKQQQPSSPSKELSPDDIMCEIIDESTMNGFL